VSSLGPAVDGLVKVDEALGQVAVGCVGHRLGGRTQVGAGGAMRCVWVSSSRMTTTSSASVASRWVILGVSGYWPASRTASRTVVGAVVMG
jgi:hypothetical protein